VIIPDRVAEVREGLRHLAVNPTLEGAQQLLDDWNERQQMYDNTESGWSPTPTKGSLRA
jgi:hypothetical protein